MIPRAITYGRCPMAMAGTMFPGQCSLHSLQPTHCFPLLPNSCHQDNNAFSNPKTSLAVLNSSVEKFQLRHWLDLKLFPWSTHHLVILHHNKLQFFSSFCKLVFACVSFKLTLLLNELSQRAALGGNLKYNSSAFKRSKVLMF